MYVSVTLMRAFLIKTFWAWFVLSSFPALPQLHLVACIGISLFVVAVKPWQIYSKREYDEGKETLNVESLGRNLGTHIGGFLITWGIGWIVHSLM
jgi:hypothetical protein